MTMSKEQCLNLVDFYENHLNCLHPDISPVRGAGGVAHVKAMFPLMREYLSKDENREKFMRWLGFVQGWLWANHIFSIDEMANHNR